MLELYTDGSAAKNRSGWGFVAVYDDGEVYHDSGQLPTGTTNQKAELIAAIEALNWAIREVKCIDTATLQPFYADDITLYSDSAYLINCYEQRWWESWMQNGWYNSKKQPVANREEWEMLIDFFKNPHIHFYKVTAHVGHAHNETADKLARGTQPNLKSINKYDIISIELSNILLSFQTNKKSYQETIKEIMAIMLREGVKMDGQYHSNTDN